MDLNGSITLGVIAMLSVILLVLLVVFILMVGDETVEKPALIQNHATTTTAAALTTSTLNVDGGASSTSTTLTMPLNSSETPTSSTISSTSSTSTTLKETPRTYTITACKGKRIEYQDGGVDCSSGYICNYKRVGRTYDTKEQIAYDACIREQKGLADMLEGPAAECASREEQKYRELCLINTASRVNDLSICDYIIAPNYKDMCIARVAVAQEDNGLCYKVKDNVLRTTCVREIDMIRILKAQSGN